jgi:hypothetical protein
MKKRFNLSYLCAATVPVFMFGFHNNSALIVVVACILLVFFVIGGIVQAHNSNKRQGV